MLCVYVTHARYVCMSFNVMVCVPVILCYECVRCMLFNLCVIYVLCGLSEYVMYVRMSVHT